MPFVGPAIAAWVTLVVIVMAAYFLFIAPRHQPGPDAAPPEVNRGWGDAATPGVRLTEQESP